MPSFAIESNFSGIIAGIDEAGRGPWAGPVVAAAVIVKKSLPRGVNDSKKLSPEQREALFSEIMMRAHTGVGIASVEEIDTLNILAATMLAMRRAVEKLAIVPDVALVDGADAGVELARHLRQLLGRAAPGLIE